MNNYLLQMIEVQASVITDLTEVNKSVAERVYKLEADSKVAFEKIAVENNRIKDLEGWQKHEQEKE